MQTVEARTRPSGGVVSERTSTRALRLVGAYFISTIFLVMVTAGRASAAPAEKTKLGMQAIVQVLPFIVSPQDEDRNWETLCVGLPASRCTRMCFRLGHPRVLRGRGHPVG